MNAVEYLTERKRMQREHEARLKELNAQAGEQMRQFSEAQERAMLRIVDVGLDDEEKEAIRAAVAERDAQMQAALKQVEDIGKHHHRMYKWSTWLCWAMFWMSGFIFRGVIQ